MPAYSVYALFNENKMFSLNSRSVITLNLLVKILTTTKGSRNENGKQQHGEVADDVHKSVEISTQKIEGGNENGKERLRSANEELDQSYEYVADILNMYNHVSASPTNLNEIQPEDEHNTDFVNHGAADHTETSVNERILQGKADKRVKHVVLEPCNSKELKCITKIDEKRRIDVHHQFWEMTYKEQNVVNAEGEIIQYSKKKTSEEYQQTKRFLIQVLPLGQQS